MKKYKEMNYEELDKEVIEFVKRLEESESMGETSTTQNVKLNSKNKLRSIQEIRMDLEVENKEEAKILSNSRNLELIFSNGELRDCIFYDEFRKKIYKSKKLPWEDSFNSISEWTDDDSSRLSHYLDKNFNITGSSLIKNTIKEIAMQNKVNRVQEYIKSTQWDGQHRIATIFSEFLGADTHEYVENVAELMLIAAVARVFEPGIKFDYMVVFVGPQGIRKSSFIEKIAGEWYSSGPPNFDSKIGGEYMQSAWIVEIDEMVALTKSTSQQSKTFITRCSDEYRVPYDTCVRKYPRKCIMIGTTNELNFLRDKTGNRRFLPITLSKEKVKSDFEQLDEQFVRQLWAEAYVMYQERKPLRLSDEMEIYAENIREHHIYTDPLEELIEEYLNMPRPNQWGNMVPEERHDYFKRYMYEAIKSEEETWYVKEICPNEIRKECLGKFEQSFNAYESKKIGEALLSLGWKLTYQKRKRVKYYGQQKLYIRDIK